MENCGKRQDLVKLEKVVNLLHLKLQSENQKKCHFFCILLFVWIFVILNASHLFWGWGWKTNPRRWWKMAVHGIQSFSDNKKTSKAASTLLLIFFGHFNYKYVNCQMAEGKFANNFSIKRVEMIN